MKRREYTHSTPVIFPEMVSGGFLESTMAYRFGGLVGWVVGSVIGVLIWFG